MNYYLRQIAGLVLLLGLLGLSLGCRVTSEKIQRWKGTQKGPAKLRAAVRDADLDLALRVEAAVALADIGVSQPLAEDLKALSEADRSRVGKEFLDELESLLQGGNPSATTTEQLRAKDALFGVRAGLSPAQQARLDEMLVGWLAADWGNRTRGEHGGDKIVGAVSPAIAGPILAQAVAGKPGLVVVLAEQVRSVGRPADRDAAAAKLIELASTQDPISPLMLEALGKVGAAASRALLLRLGVDSGADLEQRIKALQALSLDPQPSSTRPLTALAASTKQPDPIRGAAFQALEAISGTETAAALGKIIATDPNETVRYRAAEAIIRCCGAAGTARLLESLPTGYNYTRSDVVDFLEADIKGLGQKALPVLRTALASRSWIARLVAARVLGEIGGKADVAALEGLASDKTQLKEGWDAGATVGTEAQAAAERLEQRN